MDSKIAIVSFKAVVETEVDQCKEIELSEDELYESLILGDYDKENKIIELDEVSEVISQELNEMLLGIVPDELKKNCVSMTFTNIKITIQD